MNKCGKLRVNRATSGNNIETSGFLDKDQAPGTESSKLIPYDIRILFINNNYQKGRELEGVINC